MHQPITVSAATMREIAAKETAPARTFQQIIEDAGLEPSAYSGRGMGGQECLSFTYGRGALGRVMAEIVGEIRENADQETIVAALPRMREDSLGTGTVVYFPGIPFAK